MSGVLADLRHAFRLYARTPASSALVIAGLAAALAIETAFLSLWNVLELRPHPGFEARRGLITVGQNDGRFVFPMPLEVIDRIDAEATTIESIAGVMPTPQTLELETKSVDIRTELVTANYFADVGPPVLIGRAFSRADHDANAEPVAILSHALWQREFGGDTDVFDRLVRLRQERISIGSSGSSETSVVQNYRVVGVLGPRVGGTFIADVDVWLPFEQAWPALNAGRPGPPAGIPQMLLRGLARLAPGATAEAARVELAGRFGPAPGQVAMMPTARLDAIEGVVGDVNVHREVRRQVRLFLAGSVLLTLIAACNVSLFLLSRAPGRRRELAIRMTVGAVPARIARQLVTESGLLVVAATLIGLAASIWLAALLPGLAFLERVQWRNVTLFDWRVLALAAGAMLLLVLLVSLAPIAGLIRTGIAAASRREQRGVGQRLVATIQVALATVVGGAAVAFIWHVGVMTFADRGFSAVDVHVVRFEPPTPATMRSVNNLFDPGAVGAERERRRTVIGGLPGVASVTFATSVPGTRGITLVQQAAPTDDPEALVRFDEILVDSSYFALLGLRVRHGRMFAPGEGNEVVVNETFARRIWGRTDVVGELIPLQLPAGRTPLPREIVGVAEDVAFEHPNATVPPMAFGQSGRVPPQMELILVKSTLGSANLREMIEQRIATGELDLKIATLEPVMAAWSRQLAPDRARALLTAAAAFVVLLLAAVGYYGTQHYLVAAGRREYAILAAIGATPQAIHRRVLWRGLGYGLPGLVLGSVLAFSLVVWLRDGFITSDVSPLTVTALVAVGIAGLLLGATSGPARQARDLEPAPLLKED